MAQDKPRLSRRVFLAGAATAATAGAAAALPGARQAAQPAEAPAPVPSNGGGYRLSEHVKRYYKTTLV